MADKQKPEERARIKIDEQLADAGWHIADRGGVTNLESSFRRGADRALVVLATGAGKTYTACMAAYRLLSYTPAKRILFLVDRNNLGEQALNEFSTFRLTQNGAPLTDIFITERLKGNNANPKASVTIATIQRVYSALTGADARSDEDEDAEDRESDAPPVAVDGQLAKLPHDWFDAIIIDECLRSIYGRWRAVLEWFDTAKFIGLTATPSAETVEFFDKGDEGSLRLQRTLNGCGMVVSESFLDSTQRMV